MESEILIITPEALQAIGWNKMGNAWYGPGNKCLTNYDGQWQKWHAGVSVTVTTMNQL